jgi:hypothetical protein
MRLNSFFSSADSVFQGRTLSPSMQVPSLIGLIGVSCVSFGMIPRSIMRASTHSRYAS